MIIFIFISFKQLFIPLFKKSDSWWSLLTATIACIFYIHFMQFQLPAKKTATTYLSDWLFFFSGIVWNTPPQAFMHIDHIFELVLTREKFCDRSDPVKVPPSKFLGVLSCEYQASPAGGQGLLQFQNMSTTFSEASHQDGSIELAPSLHT